MNTLKLLILFILISLQANATGYSNNMFVAQRILKTKKVKVQIEPIANANGTVARITSFKKLAAFDLTNQPITNGTSVIQCISEWMIKIIGADEESANPVLEQPSSEANLTLRKRVSGCLSTVAGQCANMLKRLLF